MPSHTLIMSCAEALTGAAVVTGSQWNVSCIATVDSTAANSHTVDVYLAASGTPSLGTGACDTPIAAFTAAGSGQCTVTYIYPNTLQTSPLSLVALANDGTTSSAVSSSVTIDLGSITATAQPVATATGVLANVSVSFNNPGPVDLSGISVTGASGWMWAGSCPPTGVTASQGATPCTASYSVTDADLEGSTAKTWSIGFTANEVSIPAVTVTLPRTAALTASISGCALSSGEHVQGL